MADWEDALVELLQTRGVTLMRHARLLTGNDHDAEDLLQDALVRVFASHRRGTDPEETEAYLRTVMVNLVLDSRILQPGSPTPHLSSALPAYVPSPGSRPAVARRRPRGAQ